ncbi:MAG: purine-nucleoside phosphorylase [Deltaproteobacteria bacterium]|nr:purine-nucleoside phosphorylase [Deltaproteobacteria bacterium]MBI2341144.1 purine-nucleoside phosphorylase [Deltaproteobacteria bacterium]
MEPSLQDKIKESVDFIKSKIKTPPSILVQLGSGLQNFVDELQVDINLSYSEIPHFPKSGVEGHAGRIIFGSWKGVSIAVMLGRAHYYEGFDVREVALPIHALHIVGCKTLIVTSATGGINAAFSPGDIMMITDHINLMGVNPLRGVGAVNPKNQFPDMTNAYSKTLQQIATEIAKQLDLSLKSGVYIAVPGPSYETKAEIRAFRQWGADAVGMSTVPEVIVANYHKMQVLGFSCISNPAADIHPGSMSHAEVLKNMEALQPKLVKLVVGVIERIGNVSQQTEIK